MVDERLSGEERRASGVLACRLGPLAAKGPQGHRIVRLRELGAVEDIGYLVTVVQLPPGASLASTDAVVRELNDIMLATRASSTLPPTSVST